MMEAARTSETSVEHYFTRQYIPEDKSELYTELSCFWSMQGFRAAAAENIERLSVWITFWEALEPY
jgi:hypothetical protein